MKRLLLLLCLVPALAQAERLRIDVLIFANPPSSEEKAGAPRHPDDAHAVSMDDLRGLSYAGIALMPESASTLGPERALLLKGGYRPLLSLSWLQDSPATENGAALRLYQPGSDGISGLDGWLRLHGGGKLQLSADLELVQANASHTAEGYRLQARRTLEPGALYYLDSTRIGVLARVTPAK